jgi:lipoate-protein ligase B
MRALFLSHLKKSYSTCQGSLVKPLNNDPIGYLTLPGLVKYEKALQLQTLLVSRRHQITQNVLKTSAPADLICFLEHPPTFTAGRRLRGKSELEEEQRLKHLGADYFETMRGGQITYHGPGQLIAYPILDIRDYQVKCESERFLE